MLTLWRPFERLAPFAWANEWLNELAPFANWPAFETYEPTIKLPRFVTNEEPERYVVTAELAGFKPEEVKVTLVGNQIKIEGKHEEKGEEEGKTYQRLGTFERTFILPENVINEGIRAEMANGLFKLVLPKKEIAKPKEVPVTVTAPEPVKVEQKLEPPEVEPKPEAPKAEVKPAEKAA
jgi:HSP20 family protein